MMIAAALVEGIKNFQQQQQQHSMAMKGWICLKDAGFILERERV